MAAAIIWTPAIGGLAALAYVFLAAWSSGVGTARYLSLSSPRPWARTLLLGLLLAVAIHFPVEIVFTPLVEWLTGSSVDVSVFDFLRGSIAALLVFVPFVWVAAAFAEEVIFRGYLLKQTATQFGDTTIAWWVALAASSTVFGLAHLYQGITGVLLTGSVGFLIGFIFLRNRENLWLPIFIHGFLDTIGLTAIYLDIDRKLNDLLKLLLP
jgi:membrane protease YdiL (CAAX protease family)